MGRAATRAAALVLIALGSASACSSGGEDARGSSGQNVWAPTTVPFDPTCKGCEELGTVNLSHMGEAKLMRDSRVDDPEAQWTRCVSGILDCIEERRDESACVSESSCPGPCKADYEAHLSQLGRTDLTARWSALRAVFVSPTSRCALVSSESPEVAP